ncbi:MAG: hypothetical protein ACYTEQ_23790 [Planctomycetota bacterium]|jgi:hypothetical protein
MRIGKSRGSYLPVLSKLVSMTDGPILELGVGFCSTPFLHWACYPTRRELISVENNPEYFRFAKSWKDDFHKVHCIDDYDKLDLSRDFTIAFIDHSPGPRRGIEADRLRHANYLVIHDSENANARRYGLHKVYKSFPYRYKYTAAFPSTSIWSMTHDIRGFEV